MHNDDAKLPKLIVLLGPTAAGKTGWSLELAKKINGEIISADSRQIYKYMQVGTAKPEGKWRWWITRRGPRRTYFVEDIPHHLVDFLNPGKRFTVAEFRDKAIKYAKLAYGHSRQPMLVGGTGLYISSVVDNYIIPRVEANKELRRSLSQKDNAELMKLLETLDPKGAAKMDKNNTRRIVRALEVCILTGEPFSEQKKKGDPMFSTLQVGIKLPREQLYDNINTRVDQMMKDGLIEEIEQLLKRKYSWNLPSMSGIGYRQFRPYFEGKKTLEACVEDLKRDTRQFARRQLSWFRRDDRILWVETYEEFEKLVRDFLGDDAFTT